MNSLLMQIDAKVTRVTSSKTSLNRLRSGETDTVFWIINDGNKEDVALAQNFTLTRLSAIGDNTDQVGAIMKGVFKEQVYYYVPYTPSDVDADTISFVLSQAALHAGVPMEPDTLKNVFIIDNKVDFKCESPVVLFDGAENTIENLTLTLDFEEPLMAGDTLVISVASDAFDNFAEQRVVGADDASFVLDFVPLLNGEKIAPADFAIQVSADGVVGSEEGVRDRTRNRIDNITKSVDVTF